MTGTQTISEVWVSDYETKSFTFAPLESTGEIVLSLCLWASNQLAKFEYINYL